ncbi:MAG: phosphatidylglycerophosphatase A [bacterium]
MGPDWESLGLRVATVGALGRVPFAPGTAASGLGLLVHLALQGLPGAWTWVVLAAVALMGVWASACAEKILNQKDPPQVVIDEVLGMVACLAGLGTGFLTMGVAFGLFRTLDVLKPPPIRHLEKILPGGWAVVGDDLAAAAAVQIVMRILGASGLMAGN